MEYTIVNGELYHHGIKGQKWGVRRFQNADGTFNEAGKIRYFGKKSSHKPDSVRKLDAGSSNTRGGGQKDNGSVQNKKGLSDKQKKALKIGAAVAGTALAAYGAYKLNDKVTKDLFDSYAFVSDVLQESSKSFNKQALDNNKWAYEAKNNGASDSVVSALKDMSNEYRKRRDIDSALSDKYSNKAAFKEFGTKERMDAAKRIITKGSSEFKSQKEKEIWDEATKEFNRRYRKS